MALTYIHPWDIQRTDPRSRADKTTVVEVVETVEETETVEIEEVTEEEKPRTARRF